MAETADKTIDKTVHISKPVHAELIKHVGKKIKITAFVDEAIMEKIERDKSKK